MGVSKSKYLSFYLNRRSIKTSVESTNDVNHWDQLRPIGFDMCLLGLVQSHRTCICQETKAYTPRNYRRIRQETIDVYAFRTSISDLKGFAPRTVRRGSTRVNNELMLEMIEGVHAKKLSTYTPRNYRCIRQETI